MKQERAQRIMDQLPPALVEEAACVSYRRRRSPWLAAVACLLFCLLAQNVWRNWPRQTEAAFQMPHFTQENETFLIHTSLNRVPMEALSDRFFQQFQGREEQLLSLYYDSMEEAAADLGYPLLQQTRSVPRYSYFRSDTGKGAQVELLISRNQRLEAVAILACRNMHMVHQTANGPVTLPIYESQQLYTEHYLYEDLKTEDLSENERLLAKLTLTAADGTPVCVYHTARSEQVPGRGMVVVQEDWNVVTLKDSVLLKLQITLPPDVSITRQEILTFIEELVNSYVFTEGDLS